MVRIIFVKRSLVILILIKKKRYFFFVIFFSVKIVSYELKKIIVTGILHIVIYRLCINPIEIMNKENMKGKRKKI